MLRSRVTSEYQSPSGVPTFTPYVTRSPTVRIRMIRQDTQSNCTFTNLTKPSNLHPEFLGHQLNLRIHYTQLQEGCTGCYGCLGSRDAWDAFGLLIPILNDIRWYQVLHVIFVVFLSTYWLMHNIITWHVYFLFIYTNVLFDVFFGLLLYWLVYCVVITFFSQLCCTWIDIGFLSIRTSRKWMDHGP